MLDHTVRMDLSGIDVNSSGWSTAPHFDLDAMSGLPAGSSNDKMSNGVVSSWPPETQEILRYQWDEKLNPFWRKIVSLAKAHGDERIALVPSWWSAPFWLAYGVLHGSAMDSRWHESGHGTAFKTGWMNQAVYQIACFCMIRDPWCWRFGHARHHSDTIIVGRDPEVAIKRPVIALKLFANLFGSIDVWDGIKRTIAHASGQILPDEATYVAPNFHPKTVRTARIWLAIYAVTIATAVFFQSWVSVLLIGLPRLFGCWHMVLCGWLQHGGLADNALDHRLNSRSVYMNPVSRFI